MSINNKASKEIFVAVLPQYIDQQSEPENERYVFSYTVTITNRGSVPYQLLNRHWVITDGGGEAEDVRGEGVIGQQPWLIPNESFEYTSGAILKTPVGSMHGEYEFSDEHGNRFEVDIPVFSLHVPSEVH